MNAEEARKMSIKNQEKDEDIKESIEKTDKEIEEASSNGQRECMIRGFGNIYALKQYYEEKGFKVGQFHYPDCKSVYLRW